MTLWWCFEAVLAAHQKHSVDLTVRWHRSLTCHTLTWHHLLQRLTVCYREVRPVVRTALSCRCLKQGRTCLSCCISIHDMVMSAYTTPNVHLRSIWHKHLQLLKRSKNWLIQSYVNAVGSDASTFEKPTLSTNVPELLFLCAAHALVRLHVFQCAWALGSVSMKWHVFRCSGTCFNKLARVSIN